MKLELVVALAVLFFASMAHADTIKSANGEITIPDGSTVTSVTVIPNPDGPFWGNVTLIDYSFADGTGDTEGNSLLGYWGTINFDSPVSDVSFDWFDSASFEASDNVGDTYGAPCEGCSGVGSFPGTGVTQINWQAADEVGGITSLSTQNSQSVPEPSSLPLSGIALAALIGLKLKA
jgi:hypothetical protein